MEILKKILISLGGIILACVVLEGILQFTDSNNYVPAPIDAASGLHIRAPGSSYTVSRACFENTVSINNLGFHGPHVEVAKPPHTIRIVVLGSSFIEAEQIPTDEMFTSVLERLLNATSTDTLMHGAGTPVHYEVIPIGYSGNGTYLDVLYFERFGAVLKPDLVIDLETEYEFADESAHATPKWTASGTPDFSLPITSLDTSTSFTARVRNLYHHSKLVMNLLSRFSTIKSDVSDMIKPAREVDNNGEVGSTSSVSIANKDSAEWQSEMKLIAGLAEVVEKSGAKFMLTSWATPGAGDTIKAELERYSYEVAADHGFSYLDLQPIITADEAREHESAVWSCDNHWSGNGHRFAALAVYEYLKGHRELLK